jgi:hypothetical protein
MDDLGSEAVLERLMIEEPRDVLADLNRAHKMSTAHPERRQTLYAQAADEIARLRTLTEDLMRDRNSLARQLADQNDARLNAEEQAESAVSSLRQYQNSMGNQIVTAQLALEDIAEVLGTTPTVTQVTKAIKTAKQALARIEAQEA